MSGYASDAEIEAAARTFVAALGDGNLKMLRENLRSIEVPRCDALWALRKAVFGDYQVITPEPLTGVELLADELNQFAMVVEDYAYRNEVSANARIAPKEAARHRGLFVAARRLRERIAPLIPE